MTKTIEMTEEQYDAWVDYQSKRRKQIAIGHIDNKMPRATGGRNSIKNWLETLTPEVCEFIDANYNPLPEDPRGRGLGGFAEEPEFA